MIEGLNPGIILILGALIVPLTSGFIRTLFLLALPVLGLAQMMNLGLGSWGQMEIMGMELTLTRIDPLSRVFGLIFHIAAFAGLLYALHVKDTLQHVATLIYAGSAIGAVFAGDLITLFVFWEITAVSSVFLIWASRTEKSFHSGIRYLILQVTSGVVLLGGIALYFIDTGTVDFHAMSLDSAATWLFLIAFGIKAAFPLVHNWIQDSYPEATVTGTVILSAFTTKLAIYALVRGFPGTELLIWVGAVMVILPVVHATLENDLRRTIAHSLVSQQGLMVIAIGIGSEMAINGVAAHATLSILYTSILFMVTGAALYRTGSAKITDLGGLYKSMPVTSFFAVIGALIIIAFPLTGAFASKSLILSAALDKDMVIVWLVMLFGAIAVIDNVGLKIPIFGFFSKDKTEEGSKNIEEAPAHMILAMAILAGLAIMIGIFPTQFFSLLPFAGDYHIYTASHIVTQMQMILFAALVFGLALRYGVYPIAKNGINLDFDWLTRKLGMNLLNKAGFGIMFLWHWTIDRALDFVGYIMDQADKTHGLKSGFSRPISSGFAVSVIVTLFGIALVVAYQ